MIRVEYRIGEAEVGSDGFGAFDLDEDMHRDNRGVHYGSAIAEAAERLFDEREIEPGVLVTFIAFPLRG